MLVEERTSPLPPPRSHPPRFAFADLPAFLYAYPLHALLRCFPRATIWTVRTFGTPLFRLLHRSDERLVAGRMQEQLDLSADEARALARRWTGLCARRGCHRLQTISGKRGSEKVTLHGVEHLERALEGGKGVVLVSIHNFAIVSATRFLRDHHRPVLSVRRLRVPEELSRLGQRWLGARIVRIAEEALAGCEALPADDPNCILKLARRLREGGIVHIAADSQRAPSARVMPFLNGRRGISQGPLDLARLCRCPVLPISALFTANGVRVELGAPLELRYEGSPAQCAESNLPLLAAELERLVRANPDQWDRWLDLGVISR